MKVFIVGAAGGIGSMLVDNLISANHEVTGMVRHEEQVADLMQRGAQGVVASLADPYQLSEAMGEQDAVIFTAGSKGKALEAVDRDGAINSARAAQLARVSRFVLLSSIYAGRPDQGPDDLREYFHAKHVADKFVESTDLDYTIVRPGFLNNDLLFGSVEIGEAFDGPEAIMSRPDVASLLAQILDHPSTIGKTFEVIKGKTPVATALH